MKYIKYFNTIAEAESSKGALSPNMAYVSNSANGLIMTKFTDDRLIDYTAEENIVKGVKHWEPDDVAETGDGQIFQSFGPALAHALELEEKVIELAKDCETEDITLEAGQDLTIIGNGFKVGNVLIKDKAILRVVGALDVNDFNLQTKPKSSGQLYATSEFTSRGRASVDVQLDPSGTVNTRKWYFVSVPFICSQQDLKGIDNDGVEYDMIYDKNYMFSCCNGANRAQGKSIWATESATVLLEPTKMYLWASDKNILRFYKKADAPLISAIESIQLTKYPSSVVDNINWNGITNGSLHYVDLSSDIMLYGAQLLQRGSMSYTNIDYEAVSFAVCSGFIANFAQDVENAPTITFSPGTKDTIY